MVIRSEQNYVKITEIFDIMEPNEWPHLLGGAT